MKRYLTLVLFSGFLALIVIWYESGRIDLSWRPEIPGTRVRCGNDHAGRCFDA